MSRSFWLGLLASVLIASCFSIYSYAEASSPKYRGDSYYVSDEVWYVTSSRNLIHEVFGLKPKYSSDGYAYATIVFSSEQELLEAYDWVNSSLAAMGGSIVRANYTTTGDRIPVIWVKFPESKLGEFEELFSGRFKLRYGFEYPSKSGITDYLNLEHPPLGKYFIIASILTFGDSPPNWRIPGVIEAFFLIIIVYMIVYKLLNPFWGVIASISLALDPIFHAMSIVAMLDIHLTLFTALALLFAVYDRPVASSISSWLAFSVKFSGLFALLFTYLYLRIYRKEEPAKSFAICLIPSLSYVAISLPIINHIGFPDWVRENLNAVAWHTTSRGSGPTPSPPWAWFFNLAPMALHLNPDLLARVNMVSYIFALAFAIFLLPTLFREERLYLPMMMILSIILGYTSVYAAGNRTLYSFYAVQLAPSVACSFSISLFYLIMRESELSFVAGEWKRLLRKLAIGDFKLPRELGFLELLLRSGGGYRNYYTLSTFSATLISILLHSKFYLPGDSVFMNARGDFGLSFVLSDLLMKSSSDAVIREILFGSISLTSVILISLDLNEIGISKYPPLISLMILSGYDWSLLSLALLLESSVLMRRGRKTLPILMAGISASLNPLNVFLLPTILERPSYRDIILFLNIFIPLSFLSPKWPEEAVGGILIGQLSSLAPIISFAISIAFTILTMKLSKFWSSIFGLGLATLLTGLKPSWGITATSFLSNSPYTPLLELLLSVSLLTYNIPSLLSSIIFKCNPKGPADFCSDPFIAASLFSISLIYLGLRGLVGASLGKDNEEVYSVE